jgi:hypothetical protein
MGDSWLDVNRSSYPTLRANVMTTGGALTEAMVIEGAKAFRAYVEARRKRRAAEAPWRLKLGRIAWWLWEAGRRDEAARLVALAESIGEWGVTSRGGLDFLNGVVAEYDAAH